MVREKGKVMNNVTCKCFDDVSFNHVRGCGLNVEVTFSQSLGGFSLDNEFCCTCGDDELPAGLYWELRL